MVTPKKTFFLKSDKIGDGKLGEKLAIGFLNAISEQEELPKAIICVNSAVLLTTDSEDSEIITILKSLQQKNVSIYSCGTCLDFYNKRDDLKVGTIGNAVDTAKMLLTDNIVTL